MSCNCTEVCSIPKCIESILVGTIDPNITVTVQFKDTINNRIKQVQASSDSEGVLISDVSLINSFFSENFVYEVTILASNANQCDTSMWAIGETDNVQCVSVSFVNVPNQDDPLAIFKVIGDSSGEPVFLITEDGQYMKTEDNEYIIAE